MATPSQKQIYASIEHMKSAAGAWHTASGDLSEASKAIGPLKINRIQAGIFQVAYSAYLEAAQFVESRVNEGVKELTGVGDTLKYCADVYQREDESNAHKFKGLY